MVPMVRVQAAGTFHHTVGNFADTLRIAERHHVGQEKRGARGHSRDRGFSVGSADRESLHAAENKADADARRWRCKKRRDRAGRETQNGSPCPLIHLCVSASLREPILIPRTVAKPPRKP